MSDSRSRLSEAEIWTRLRRFYEGADRQAFRPGGIPFQITSNPAISHAYASMVASWIGDWLQCGELDPRQPVSILELGPGTGRFTFLFTQDLRRLLKSKGLEHLCTRHICADLGRQLLDEIAGHERIAPLVSEGLLDFTVFDATDPRPPHLLRSGEMLTRELLGNHPLIVIANYFFDSLPQDCFTVRGGRLYESLVRMSGDGIEYEHRPVAVPYYHDTELDHVLDACRACGDGAILLPVAALRLLRWLWELASGRLLLLAADKGYCSASEVAYPAIETHADNCVSMMVYFKAIEEFWKKRGGCYRWSHREGTFLTFAAAEAGLGCEKSCGVAQSFAENLGEHTPEDWDVLSWRSVRDAHLFSVSEMLACMRLSHWDPAVLNDFFPALFRNLAGIPEWEKAQVMEAVRKSLDRYYHLGEAPDLVFKGASLIYELGNHAEALLLFERSRELSGLLPAIRFQMGRCLYRLGRREEALRQIRAALEEEPDFENYLVGMGILPERRAADLAARIEWELSLPG